jgi:hypothetical protein
MFRYRSIGVVRATTQSSIKIDAAAPLRGCGYPKTHQR